jgi:pimeloyl-ACP methyl ester carboxylesterase
MLGAHRWPVSDRLDGENVTSSRSGKRRGPRATAILGLCAGVALLVPGCATAPSSAFDSAAGELGLVADVVSGGDFVHRALWNAAARSAPGPKSRLHLYIDGDGTPWLGPGRPAADPTPRNPLVLRLVALDPAPSVYLGRPCYAGLADAGSCHPWHWTHARYGPQVVDSMSQAARRLAASLGATQLSLIGYSGGGALAMLIAERLAGVTDVVTLAGNLDVAGWSELHDYSPLDDSLDPSARPPLPAEIRQWHWVGADDAAVPPALVRGAVEPRPGVIVEVLPGMDHACCWEQAWPELLRRLP